MDKPLTKRDFPLFAFWTVGLLYVTLAGPAATLVSAAGLVTALFLAVVVALWGWLAWRQHGEGLGTPLDAGLLAVGVALVLSAVFSLDPSRSWRMVWNWLAPIVVFYAACAIFRAGGSVQTLIKAYLIVMFVYILFGYRDLFSWLWQWYAVFGFSLMPGPVPRLFSLTSSPNILAAFLNMGWPLALTYRTAEGKWPLAAHLWLAAGVPILLLTGSRSAFLGLLVSGGVLYASWAWWRARGGLRWRTWLRLLVGLAGAAAVVVAVVIWIRPDTLQAGGRSGVFYRGSFWGVALTMWHESPLIGRGLDTFGSFYMLHTPNVPPTFPFRAAHSLWFSLLAEVGLVGAGTALLCWFLIGRFLWRRWNPEHWSLTSLGLLAALTAFAVHATFDTPEAWVLLLAALLLAALVTQLEVVEGCGYGRVGPLIYLVVAIILLAGSAMHWRAARMYEAGLAEAEAGNWIAAAANFDKAQTMLPYPEASFYLGSALTHGTLAWQDASHIAPAITAYERLIAAEPGWPTNYANLAALYWEQGDGARAIELLETAASIAPEISIYPLNAGLIAEALGDREAADRAFSALAAQPEVWGAAPFWKDRGVDFSSPQDDGWAALARGDGTLAAAAFAQVIEQNPYDGRAYLGLGIAEILQGNRRAAQDMWRRAALLGDGGWGAIWLAATDSAQPLSLGALSDHSTFGMTGSNVHVYPITIFNRLNLPLDLLPQLWCISLDGETAKQLALLQTWQQASGKEGAAEQLNAALLGDGRGLTSCSASMVGSQ